MFRGFRKGLWQSFKKSNAVHWGRKDSRDLGESSDESVRGFNNKG